MLRRLKVTGFKSIREAQVELPALTVLFGPNAAGKSNFLDAVQALSRLATERTLAGAMADPIRGHPIEAFAFPPGGLTSLLDCRQSSFALEADLELARKRFRYGVEVAIQPGSGSLSLRDEYLTALTTAGEPKGTASIEKVEGQLRIRRKGKASHPRHEPLGQNHTILSDPRLAGPMYPQVESCRGELVGWRVYYLDPRVAMRSARPPAEVSDIGVLGEHVAPFLYRLKAERSREFSAIKRALRAIVPGVEDLDVDLDKRRGTLDILVRQDGTDFSSRILSEGTLRVLALCCVAVNPWGGSLIAFEEPENGVHPRRVELIARLLVCLALERQPPRQVIVTTHSPLLCDTVLKSADEHLDRVALLNVRQGPRGTCFEPLDAKGPLFTDQQLRKALADSLEDAPFAALELRGLLDG